MAVSGWEGSSHDARSPTRTRWWWSSCNNTHLAFCPVMNCTVSLKKSEDNGRYSKCPKAGRPAFVFSFSLVAERSGFQMLSEIRTFLFGFWTFGWLTLQRSAFGIFSISAFFSLSKAVVYINFFSLYIKQSSLVEKMNQMFIFRMFDSFGFRTVTVNEPNVQ